MGKVTLDEVIGLQDPLTSSMYELIFLDIPDAVIKPPGYTDRLVAVACQSCTLPGKTIEDVPVDLHNSIIHYSGKVTFGGTMTLTFVETRNMLFYHFFYDWMSYIKSHKTQLGQYKVKYSSQAILRIFDQNQTVVGAFKVYGLWPNTLPELTFDGGNALITIPAGFMFDYCERIASGDSPADNQYAIASSD